MSIVSTLFDSNITCTAMVAFVVSCVCVCVVIVGLLWPIESLPKALQIISRLFPAAYPADAFQAIMIRGQFLVCYCNDTIRSVSTLF